ncbi:MAG: DDE-type integrase/transposase/recombinase [Methyloceanibacter sp.]
MFVRINGETHYLWRAVDHEGEVLEVFATNRRDRQDCQITFAIITAGVSRLRLILGFQPQVNAALSE